VSLASLVTEPLDVRDRITVAVVAEIGAVLQLDVAGAGIFRIGTSTLVGLPAAGLLARVDDPGHVGEAERQVSVAFALEAAGVPAVRLAGPESQPVRTTVGAITFWQYEPPGDAAVTPAEIGRLARQLHEAFRAPESRAGLPPFEPFSAIARQLDDAARGGATDAGALARLRSVADELRGEWDEVAPSDPLGLTLVHGDLHEHNVLSTSSGPALADLELGGVGPACYDLVPSLVAVLRYGQSAERYEAFARGYGYDVRDWSEGCRTFVDVYELWVTAWTVANRAVSDGHEAEAALRTRRWTDPSEDDRPWRLL
jgi:hypothetical protein